MYNVIFQALVIFTCGVANHIKFSSSEHFIHYMYLYSVNVLFWVTIFLSGNFSIPYQYIVSLYWATATTTTVGYGDIRAHTDFERVYATFVMIIGVVAYGYIIASVAASLANADSGRAQYQDKLKAVKAYLKVRLYLS